MAKYPSTTVEYCPAPSGSTELKPVATSEACWPSRLGFIPAPASAPAAEGRLRLPVLTGLLQGAANPALFLNWTLFISFLVGPRLLVPTAAGAGGVALGVGL